MSDILIGTSGYDHPELKGTFYPGDLPRKDFLSYYATRFNSLELNSTFYSMPTVERMESFYQRSGGSLMFSIKANRLLTHEISASWKDQAVLFRNAIHTLAQKQALASILFQFPESFHYTPQNRVYLANLLKEFEPFPKVVEFRHKEWIKDSVFEGLACRKAGIVFCDMPHLKNLPNGFTSNTPFISNIAYIRFHGRNSQGWYVNANSSTETPRYDYEYSQNELSSFIPIIKAAQSEGKTVMMYFNNHPKGTGIKNALQMEALLSENSASIFSS